MNRYLYYGFNGIEEYLKEYINSEKPTSIVELGCGKGEFTFKLYNELNIVDYNGIELIDNSLYYSPCYEKKTNDYYKKILDINLFHDDFVNQFLEKTNNKKPDMIICVSGILNDCFIPERREIAWENISKILSSENLLVFSTPFPTPIQDFYSYQTYNKDDEFGKYLINWLPGAPLIGFQKKQYYYTIKELDETFKKKQFNS